jgi:hypothetical protein
MFNLDEAITAWRRELAGGGVKAAEILDELENHLREDVGQQLRSGFKEQQAFEVAVRRIGQAVKSR